ncbi:hypothetical protein GR254_17985 [Mycobacterium tuberculosis]|nr:hypothetical protein [Mycobacterium tuberculosis]
MSAEQTRSHTICWVSGSSRFDIADMRNWRPGWFPTMHSRCLSNLIHDRIWAHLVTLIASNPGTSIKVNRPGESGDSLI